MNYIEWIFEKLTEEDRKKLLKMGKSKSGKGKLPKCEDGEIFKVADMEFIKFPDEDGSFAAVAKESLFDLRFGNDNNLSTSDILKRLEKDVLPKIEEAVGAENVLAFTTDLTTLDGLKPYEDLTSKISLPTFYFYRKNVATFDKYKLGKWWWLATPNSAASHASNECIVCVSPRGNIGNCIYRDNNGVRPFLRFSSSIFESCED